VLAPLSATAGAPFIVVASIVAANVRRYSQLFGISGRRHCRNSRVATEIARSSCASCGVRANRVLDFAAALILLVALTIVLGIAVFGPGRVTIHRILGAIAIYLNVAATCALAYRMIDALSPGAFSSNLADRSQTTG